MAIETAVESPSIKLKRWASLKGSELEEKLPPKRLKLSPACKAHVYAMCLDK